MGYYPSELPTSHQSIQSFSFRLNWDSFRTFSTPSIHDSLFPNLQHVQFGDQYISKIQPLPPHQLLPSLVSIYIWPNYLGGSSTFQGYLKWFSELSSHVTTLHMSPRFGMWPVPEVGCNKIAYNHICGWQNLQVQIVDCPAATFDMDTLAHLSHMPALTSNIMPDEMSPSNSPLLFSNLSHLGLLQSGSLVYTSRLLAYIQLPALTDLTVETSDCPSGVAVQTACITHSIILEVQSI